jgi:hypothetical protein
VLVVHEPALHTWLPMQRPHAPPPAPQAWVDVPDWQVPKLSQQPAQVDGPHGGVPQLPFRHWVPEQLEHVAPPKPQAVFDVPVTHVPFAVQQPPQLAAEQVATGRHWFDWQLVPVPQATHEVPCPPHAVPDVPGRHTPPAQQPVLQLDALHCAGWEHVPP